jgi:hypothetical protein
MAIGKYAEFERKAINNFNWDGEKSYGSLEQCKRACTENSQCLSFEILRVSNGGICTTGSVTYNMINAVDPTQIRDDNNYDLYSKTCS